HPDSWDKAKSPTHSCQMLGDTHPARAVLVLFAFSIPGKLDFNSAVWIRVYLLSSRSDDLRRLNSEDARPSRTHSGPENLACRYALKAIDVALPIDLRLLDTSQSIRRFAHVLYPCE